MTTKSQFTEKTLLFELRAGHLGHHFHYTTIRMAIVKSLKTTWRNQALKSGEARPIRINQKLLTARNHCHIPLFRCYCWLLVQISVFKHLDTIISQCKPLRERWYLQGPLSRLTLRLDASASTTTPLFQNSKIWSSVSSRSWISTNHTHLTHCTYEL